jgi:hypothetical protein
MQAREHGPHGAALELDALHVHCDVVEARGRRRQRERGGERSQARSHADEGHAQRVGGEAEPQRAAAPEAGGERAAQRQAEHRAALDAEDRDRELAGRQAELRLHGGDARAPGCEDATGGEEDHGGGGSSRHVTVFPRRP